jgi:enoyl-CoA hydratase/carnithine racemase
MPYQTLTLETRGPVARIQLTRPNDRNPIDQQFLQELSGACDAINDNADVRVALLSAEGDAFSRGWAGTGTTPDALRGSPPFTCLEDLGQPVICALNGDATSAGLELALACDVRVASESARFSLPETARGELPRAGGTQRLARLVGRAHALRMLLLAEPIDAVEALRVGLVSAIHPRETLLAEAEALALTMASRGPIALRYAKEAVRRGLEQPLDQALRFETDLTVILQTTGDRAEGARAFVEKREPDFKGR